MYVKRGNHLSSKQITVTDDELIAVLHLPLVSLIRIIARNYLMTYLYLQKIIKNRKTCR